MHEHADHHDAELLLRLYDLRREEKLRRAREWLLQEFQAEPAEELLQRYPFGSDQSAYFRMVSSYWSMAASLVKHGLIQEELFFENNREFWLVWRKVKPAAMFIRERYKDPEAFKNLEELAEKYEKWMEKRSPGTLAALLERFQTAGSTKP
jgi:hypothetical protein